MCIRHRGPARERAAVARAANSNHVAKMAAVIYRRDEQTLDRADTLLPLDVERVIQHSKAANFLGADPEFLADEIFAFGQHELQRGSLTVQVENLPRLAAAIG